MIEINRNDDKRYIEMVTVNSSNVQSKHKKSKQKPVFKLNYVNNGKQKQTKRLAF